MKVEATVGLVQVSTSWAQSWAVLGYALLWAASSNKNNFNSNLFTLLAINGVRHAINYENVWRMYKHVFELERECSNFGMNSREKDRQQDAHELHFGP